MKRVRRSDNRGKANHGWLHSNHTFSFGDYYDPNHMGFGALRVINEDRVSAGQGFGTHPHNNMEIFSYVLSGELAHRESMGNGRTIKAGEFQAMSAGTGVTHSEYNPSKSESVHFIQIWIVPNQKNLPPSYAEWKPTSESESKIAVLASPDGRNGSIVVHQDATILLGKLKEGDLLEYQIKQGRKVWLQLLRGDLYVDEELLQAGDGLAVEMEESITVRASNSSEFLMFDLA